MHEQFVEPSRQWAHRTLSGEQEPDVEVVLSWALALRDRQVGG
jgi:hypothetical protein